jgi:AAA family ATP:ADP antiporter
VSGETSERKAAGIAFACHFLLMCSYYILRPVRDTVATLVGIGHLSQLFTATFVGTLAASALYTALASRVKLARLLPGTFGFWLLNIVVFATLFGATSPGRALGYAYYIWFSVANLFMISLFWSFMVDLFSPTQATRWFAFIAAGGALGAITGPLLTRILVKPIGLSGLMLVAAAGFALVIFLVQLLIVEKLRLRVDCEDTQQSTLDHALSGGVLDGFRKLLGSRYFLNQAAFMLLMTWVNTVAYFCQTDLIARSYSQLADRAQVIADMDLIVNTCTAVILLGGLGQIVRRFGVTSALVLNPLLMLVAFAATALSPTLLVIEVLQVVRRVAQYAIARPSREICFTVVEQGSRYKAKNVIDTVVYRLGDVSSAWLQTGLEALGYGMGGAVALGIAASAVWGGVAVALGRGYERSRHRGSGAAASSAALNLQGLSITTRAPSG